MKKVRVLLVFAMAMMIGLNVQAQSKKDTTVYFKAVIDCPGCKAKLEKNLPFEKGIKDLNVDMEKGVIKVTFQKDKNTIEKLKAAIEKHSDTKVLGECCPEGNLLKKSCSGDCKDCSGDCKNCSNCAGKDKAKVKECCEGHDHDHGHKHDHK